MELSTYYPIWDSLSADQQNLLRRTAVRRQVPKGTMIHSGSMDCAGMLLIQSGQLRGYILSEEGRQVTVYRLFDREICILSASCILRSIQFEIFIQAEKDTVLWAIPPEVFDQLMTQSAPAANYTREIMEARLSDVMWLVEQVMWRSMDSRVAAFLLEEASIEGTNLLKITHETIANHLGTHREVVTRMLRYFQAEGLINLSRGVVELVDAQKLRSIVN